MKDLSLHLLDIVRNSVVAKATRIDLSINEDLSRDRFTMTIEDNGKGMDKITLTKVVDPFFTTRTTRKVGLGLSLLKANCEATNGDFDIQSTPEVGTKVTAIFTHSHIDRPPLGDLPATIVTLLMSEENFDLTLNYTKGPNSFEFSTMEIKDMMDGDVDFSDYQIAKWLEDYIRENLAEIK
jgi:hypothetical protein